MNRALLEVSTATDVAAILGALQKDLGRAPRVYVIGHKERPKAEVEELMRHADIAVMKDAWDVLDDRSRYEWVNR